MTFLCETELIGTTSTGCQVEMPDYEFADTMDEVFNWFRSKAESFRKDIVKNDFKCYTVLASMHTEKDSVRLIDLYALLTKGVLE
jgi:hypothetical protein